MKIFPAIDIKNKRCVRLIKGDFDKKTEYELSPIEQAGKYKDHGFKNLHIVDLDGALTGETVNLDIIQEIVTKFDLKIEIGGGVRNFESIQKYTDAGVEKVILGSAAIKDKNFLKQACKNFPNKIAVGIDAKNSKVMIEGWVKKSNISMIDLAKSFQDVGVSAIIYTDIAKDGMMLGPDFTGTKKLMENVSIPIIASGGISSISDLEEIKKSCPELNGVICGRALYDKKINVDEAIRVLN